MATHIVPSTECRNRAIRAAALETIRLAWGFLGNLRAFPAPQPVSLDLDNLDTIDTDNYLVSEKVDGVRYLLVLGRTRSGQAYSVLVDRSLRCYQCSVAALDRFFAGGCVFDGELVTETKQGYEQPRQVFMVFDLVSEKGRDWKRVSYLERMERLHHLFDLNQDPADYTPDEWVRRSREAVATDKIVCIGNDANLVFRVKACMNLQYLDLLIRKTENLPYHVDGLIFTPIHSPLGTGTQHDLFKWKAIHTIDVSILWNRDSPEGRLLIMSDDQLVDMNEDGFYHFTLIETAELKSIFDHLRDKGISSHRFIAECIAHPDGRDVALTFYRLRRDKNKPNNIVTVNRTLESIVCRVSEEDLVERFSLRPMQKGDTAYED